jgi:CYTH domain-containing protein
MGQEIERKFMVQSDAWRTGQPGILCRQGYLVGSIDCTVRVRIHGEDGFLTIKGRQQGISRPEFEYAIPAAEAQEMLDRLCPHPLVEKYRFVREYGGLKWEIDEFIGDNQGLVVAEVELRSVDQSFARPDWLGREVSDDPRYLNVNLATRPYGKW